MATIDDFGASTDTLDSPAFGGATGWAAAVRDAIVDLQDSLVVTHPNTDDVKVTVGGQTVHYDSGWRDISSLLEAGITPIATTGYARLRRVNSTVWFGLRAEITGTPSGYRNASLPLLTCPTGFAPASAYVAYGSLYVSSALPLGMVQNMATNARMDASIPGATATVESWTTGDDLLAAASWNTNSPIPTSLPGTLVSAAPA